MIEVTSVRFSGRPEGEFLSYATIVLAECFVINNARLVQLEESGRRMLSMPRRKRTDGKWEDVVHPIKADFRSHLERVVFEAFDRQLATTQHER